MKIHHVGYLVANIDKAMKTFGDLGYELTQDTVNDTGYGVDISFMKNGDYLIELVSPVTEESVVRGLMKRFKNSPYHICYECDQLEAAVDDMKSKGFVAWDEPHVAPALQDKRVCFMIHPKAGMIELVEVGQ